RRDWLRFTPDVSGTNLVGDRVALGAKISAASCLMTPGLRNPSGHVASKVQVIAPLLFGGVVRIRARFDFPPPAKFRGVARAAICTWHQYHPSSFAGNAPGSGTDRSRALFAHQAALRKARKTERCDQLGRPSARDQLRHRFT